LSIVRVGQWKAADFFLRTGPATTDLALKVALRREAQLFRTELVKGIRSGAPGGKRFKPLSPFTIATRRFRGFRGTKPLNAGGDLVRSLKVVERPDGIFVGVLRSARNRDGDDLVNVAAVQEFGATSVIRLNPGMSRFLGLMFRQSGLLPPSSVRSTLVVRVPARPSFQPVAEMLRKGAKGRVEKTINKVLKP